MTDLLLDATQILYRAGYELRREIGSGAFGTVYEATRFADGTTVALKVLKNLSANESGGRVDLFVREMTVLRGLRHPRIVEFIEAGPLDRHVFWYAMEHVPGVSLRQLVGKCGPLSVPQSLTILRQLLEGLDAAHRAKPPGGPFVHRDVKPSNILVDTTTSAQSIKLSDFGMAKNYELAGRSQMTKTGEIRGTPAYMSPEQVLDSKYVGPEGDIFAAGAVVYFALTGAEMYRVTSDTPASAIFTLISQRQIVPLRERRPDVPDVVEQIFHRAIGTDSVRRFRSARQFLLALDTAHL